MPTRWELQEKAFARAGRWNVNVGADKILRRVPSGTADAAIRFDDLFRKGGVEEKINLQSSGAQAKPYQVKQVRAIILKAKLGDRE